ncbi:fatty acid desaturase [Pseudodonghicola flavimaris]|uniref:Fatty acid desaturase n=1 Tax=Pseudodonghicola flavimaris TaxID=3050036 RepID=A0ABT7F562_9RHOB|nr:fatty acid desaturase [Pseudodonghicola flavimaris]MDK3019544.1 fatty acid desaturase [Pseudodonghicola flavimaris]
MSRQGRAAGQIDWPTVLLIPLCYGGWMAALWLLPLWAGWPLAVLAIVLHSSLSHEVLHGHPTRWRWLNEASMALPIGLAFPYNRFRDLHLAHHRDANLTDPYDDPESNYLDPAVWAGLPRWRRRLFRANNTLLGRILLGPAIGQASFLAADFGLAGRGDRAVWLAWGLHLPGVALVIWLVLCAPMPLGSYLSAAYAAMGVLKIRTFLEHRAHQKTRARTVIVEDRGPLAFLFLNNNLHVVHHLNPAAPWYRLPALYRAGRQRYLAVNDGYRYRSYAEVFRHHFLRAKDPVPHPLWPQG